MLRYFTETDVKCYVEKDDDVDKNEGSLSLNDRKVNH